MPELPEVQTIVDELNKKIKGESVKNIWTNKENLFRNISFEKFKKGIKNKKILKVKRRAKYIIIELSDDYILLVHLKMTGHFLLGNWEIKKDEIISLEEGAIKEDKYNNHIHIIFDLSNKKQLAFSDLRQFGEIELYKKQAFKELTKINKLGIEPLSKKFSFKKFKEIIKKRKTNIKKVLMDQEKIAGIGNIYASEILFLAKVNPKRNTENLEEKEIKSIYKAILKVLEKALKCKGVSISDYRRISGEKGTYQDCIMVYNRRGEKCLNCGAIIEYININQRGTYYCPRCQK